MRTAIELFAVSKRSYAVPVINGSTRVVFIRTVGRMMDCHINAKNVIREITAGFLNRTRKDQGEISDLKIVIE
jgi:hypothetical protein